MQGTEGLVCSYRVCSFSQGINGQCSATLVQLFLLVYSWYCDGLQDVLIALVVAAADYTVMCLQSRISVHDSGGGSTSLRRTLANQER